MATAPAMPPHAPVTQAPTLAVRRSAAARHRARAEDHRDPATRGAESAAERLPDPQAAA